MLRILWRDQSEESFFIEGNIIIFFLDVDNIVIIFMLATLSSFLYG